MVKNEETEQGRGKGDMNMDSDSSSSSPHRLHILLFPFMSKGHTLPILHLASLLLRRRCYAVTIFTTPANRPFISRYLAGSDASVVELPFPEHVEGLPTGVESTEKLPSVSLFLPFVQATKRMQPHFEHHLGNLAPPAAATPACLVSDGFLWWTQESASRFGIPRLVYYGMSIHAMTLSRTAFLSGHLFGPQSDDEPFSVPEFPWINLTKNDFEPAFRESAAQMEFTMKSVKATAESAGLLINSFPEIDSGFLDYWNREFKNPKAWYIGPLCLAQPSTSELWRPEWLRWLDEKLTLGESVLYVAFGTQADISTEQLREIAVGLEESGANFFWVRREKDPEEEVMIGERGLVVREWVDQRGILSHGAVQGFLSHCGWNSVMESVCAAVPVLAWPMMAEQHLNARLVVEEMKAGIRVETADGSVRGFVKRQGLQKMVKELMEGEMGRRAREKVKELAAAATAAMEEGGGSSWQTLDHIIHEICMRARDK